MSLACGQRWHTRLHEISYYEAPTVQADPTEASILAVSNHQEVHVVVAEASGHREERVVTLAVSEASGVATVARQGL